MEFCKKCGKLVIQPHTCTGKKAPRQFKHSKELREYWRKTKRIYRQKKKLEELKEKIGKIKV